MNKKREIPNPVDLERAATVLRAMRQTRSWRDDKNNMSQQEVARASLVSRQYVSLWERGQLPWRDRTALLMVVHGYRFKRNEADEFFKLLAQNTISDEDWHKYGSPHDEFSTDALVANQDKPSHVQNQINLSSRLLEVLQFDVQARELRLDLEDAQEELGFLSRQHLSGFDERKKAYEIIIAESMTQLSETEALISKALHHFIHQRT